MLNNFTTTINDDVLINIKWQSYLNKVTKKTQNEINTQDLSYHLINVKKIMTTRTINVDNRVVCNITENKFFYKLKIKLKHYEFSKHLRIILNYRFSQYSNNIKSQEVLLREIEVKNKVEAEAVVNKEKKKKNITKRNIKTS